MADLLKPFDVTKAVDLTDAQIATTWVDLKNGGFSELVDPRMPMPLVLLGGKGSGRTHLMRHYSYQLQKLRAGEQDVVQSLRQEGYLGIYVLCESLESGRFEGKGQTPEAWSALFSYYMDLWLAQVALMTIGDAFGGKNELGTAEATIAKDVTALFDTPITPRAPTLAGLVGMIEEIRSEVNVAVDNAALSRSLGTLAIRATRGRLVFGVPAIAVQHLPSLRDLRIVYLIDEFENLVEPHQRYVNTLVREKKAPCTFKIGSRLYGYRTRETLSAGETNRVGSEFELLYLDDHLRDDSRYDDFARDLVAQRLRAAGYPIPQLDASRLRRRLGSLFEEIPPSDYEREATAFVHKNYAPNERPYLLKLERQISECLARGNAPGLSKHSEVQETVACLQCTDFPLLEKVNVFLLYRDWGKRKSLKAAAVAIEEDCRKLLAGADASRHQEVLSHFKGDLLAQILRECRQPQRYLGLQTFIDMSSGLPRHLLIVLKFIHRWAVFEGQDPFHDKPVTMSAQQRGVLQAANWFFEDAQAAGIHNEAVHQAIERLARFFHDLRFSDKPVESSLTSFSFDKSTSSDAAQQTIEEAHSVSLLLRIHGGQKDRNDGGVMEKYQINPMLCPRWDLPLARRGVVHLSEREINTIFGSSAADFDPVLGERLSGMNAPFRPSKDQISKRAREKDQIKLPGMD